MITSFIFRTFLGTIPLIIILVLTGCKKFVEVNSPATSVTEENVYKTDATAIAVLTNIYARMATEGLRFTGSNSISLLLGLSADELSLASAVSDNKLLAYYRNELRTISNETYGTDYWNASFSYIFYCNAAIEGLNKSESLTPSMKKQLQGEAKFMRAFYYFFLVNLYGDVPIMVTTNPNVNASLPRASGQLAYQQIVADLKEAQQLLSDNYLNKDMQVYSGTPERVRPTKWVATALLARTYLYMREFANAEAEASKIITNSSQFSLVTISNVFLKNSTEAIWQLQPVQTGRNTEDAFTFILPATGPNVSANPVYLSQGTLNAFESGDLRRKGGNWIDSVIVGGNTYFFPFKYKARTTSGSVSEYLMVFRLAEQYLIRAEARAQLNNIGGAKTDLNEIRTRAGLSNTTANDQTSLLAAILKERHVELFTELGQRWLDLKRTGSVDAVMTLATPIKASGRNWQSYQQLYPILFSDILKNPNLVQNGGY